jgi:hypothetical protein
MMFLFAELTSKESRDDMNESRSAFHKSSSDLQDSSSSSARLPSRSALSFSTYHVHGKVNGYSQLTRDGLSFQKRCSVEL